MKYKDVNKYDDIINLPHHQSKKRPHMSLYDRAAQFAPFAALTGHSDAIKETARLTNTKIELSEEEKELLNQKLQIIENTIGKNIIFEITYFVSDEKKSGGKYISQKCKVKKLYYNERIVCLYDGTIINVDDIIEIKGDIFKKYENTF